MSSVIDARHETPIWIRSGADDILAVITHPVESADLGVVLLTGGGWMPAPHRNRMFVDLARQLAEIGCTVVRFDYSGVGESTGQTKVFDSMHPHAGDAAAVVAALGETGVTRVIMVGTCYGGRTALSVSKSVEGLVGLVLSAVPVKDYGGADRSLGWHARRAWSMQTLRNLPSRYPKYLRIIRFRVRRLLSPSRSGQWNAVSRRYLDAMQDALSRGVRILLLEGTQDKHHSSFVEAMEDSLGELVAHHPDAVSVVEMEGELHGELWPESQAFTRNRAIDFVAEFLTSSRD